MTKPPKKAYALDDYGRGPQGLKCPKCRHYGSFEIEAGITVIVDERGEHPKHGSYNFDDDFSVLCPNCFHADQLRNFKGLDWEQRNALKKILTQRLQGPDDILDTVISIVIDHCDPDRFEDFQLQDLREANET